MHCAEDTDCVSEVLAPDNTVEWQRKVVMIVRSEYRCFFGLSSFNHSGFFIDRQMSPLVSQYSYSVDYIPGDQVLRVHSKSVHCAVLSSDCRYLFTGSSDDSIICWDLQTGDMIHHWAAHTNSIHCLAYSMGSLVSGSRDESIAIWDAHTLELQRRIDSVGDVVWSLDISEDGNDILSSFYDGTIKIWSLHSGDCRMVLYGHKKSVDRCLYLRSENNNNIIFSSSRDKSLKMWDLSTKECTHTVKWGILDIPTSLCLNKDGSLIGFCTGDGIMVYDTEKLQRRYTVDGSYFQLCFHPLWTDVAVAGQSGDNGWLSVVNVVSGETLKKFKGQDKMVTDLCFTQDGSRLISVSSDHTTCVWDLSSFQIT